MTESEANPNNHLMVTPVILSGGAGSRLWPLSSDAKPKQFHALNGEVSLFAQTLQRVKAGQDIHFQPPVIVCGVSHEVLARQACLEVDVRSQQFVLEPTPRNTAPALAAVAYGQSLIDPSRLMLVLPADHIIASPEVMRQACIAAATAAQAGKIITFGIVPSHPETGYGYIKGGHKIDAAVVEVAEFAEKPSLALAQSYVASGDYVWNAGIFFFQCQAFLDELALYEPDLLAMAKSAVDQGRRDNDDILLDATAFGAAKAISIDHAVMERTRNAGVVPVDMGWNDVGSFATLFDIGDKDENTNVTRGPTALFESANNLVISDQLPVAVIGMSDIMVIATPTGILVAPIDRSQDVRLAAEAFKKT
jgi:mannose-1-phosphate guanylyltransferase / mannose-6-phosphate isomerase